MSEKIIKVVCSLGHREVLVPGGKIPYRLEDTVHGMVPEDYPLGDPRRDDEPIVLRAGAIVRASAREARPDGGSKLRLRCQVPCCPLDVELSWARLNRGEVGRELRENENAVVKIELWKLAG